MREVGWISRRDGEWVIIQMFPGWDRLFSCWDDAHPPGPHFEHFHLAANADPDSRARSFAGVHLRALSKCAFRITAGPNMSKYTADCVEYA